MIVFPLPGGADHPHQSGVRFGKCQASRNVMVPDWPGGTVVCWQSAPTALCGVGSVPSWPCFENSSQYNNGAVHHASFGHPRQCVTFVLSPGMAAKTKLPCIGSSDDKVGLLINKPSKC